MNCVYCFVSVVTFICMVYSTFADEQTTQISNIINGASPPHGVLQDLNAIVAAISAPVAAPSSSPSSSASSFLSKEDSIEENNETMIDNGSSGAATRGVISDIAKLKKIGEILETVGSKVIPALVDGPSSSGSSITKISSPQTAAGVISATAAGESQVKPIGLKLLHAFKQQENINDNAVKIDGIRTEII